MRLKTLTQFEREKGNEPEESLDSKNPQNLTVEQIGTKLQKVLPPPSERVNVLEILERRGLSVENLISHFADLMETTQDERIRKDLILEGLTMQGVRNKETESTNTINLVIQDKDVKIQNILIPTR